MSAIIDTIKGLLQSLWGFIKFVIFLPFTAFEIFIVFMGIMSTVVILWWVFSVKIPTNIPPVTPSNITPITPVV